MFLRMMDNPPEGIEASDALELLDERTGTVVNSAVVHGELYPDLFPNRPLRIFMEFESSPVHDMLLGAALARARLAAYKTNAPARIYTSCARDDREFLESLLAMGFEDDDALLRMRLELSQLKVLPFPLGYTRVDDCLTDPVERAYFLERYNRLYRSDRDEAWLDGWLEMEGFRRILALGPKGVAGEVLCWRDGSMGIIGFLHVSKGNRHWGIGSSLISQACVYLRSLGLRMVEMNLHASIPYMSDMLEKLGFREQEKLVLYPGLDVDDD